MGKRMIVFGLIGLGLLIIAHHWLTKGVLVEMEDVTSHEFLAGICLALGLGGLIFAKS